MAKLEDVQDIIDKKIQMPIEIINVETNVSDNGHFLDCKARLLDEIILIRLIWD